MERGGKEREAKLSGLSLTLLAPADKFCSVFCLFSLLLWFSPSSLPHPPLSSLPPCAPPLLQARFQGQFLTDKDVGLPSAPKNRSGGSLGLNQGRQQSQPQPQIQAAGPGPGPSGSSSSSGLPAARGTAPMAGPGPGTTAPLLEIRPRRAAGTAAGAQAPDAGKPSSAAGGNPPPPERERGLAVPRPAVAGPDGATEKGTGAAREARRRLGGMGGSGDEDSDFEFSLRMRGRVGYLHPSVDVERLPGVSGARAAGTAAVGRGEQAEGARGEEEVAAARSSSGGGDEEGSSLLAPVSGVSLGLLRSASRMRQGSERKRLAAGSSEQPGPEAAAAATAATGVTAPAGALAPEESRTPSQPRNPWAVALERMMPPKR